MGQPYDHIDDLIGKYLAGEATAEECRQVEEWANESTSHKKQFEHFKLIFERASSVKNVQPFDADKAWLGVKAKMTRPRAKAILLRPYVGVLRAAAVLIVAVGVGYLAYQWTSAPGPVVTLASQNEVVTDSLPDGSLAVLNKRSTLTYTFEARSNKRKVELRGEAYFEVKHQEGSPFVIEAGEVTIEDIGTAFNVTAFPESQTIEVYVESGEVAFYSRNNKGLNLVAGETGIYHKASQSFDRASIMDANQLAYKTGMFSFNNADLETIIKDLNSVYSAQIRLSDEALGKCLLNVSFNNEKLQDIVEIIAETLKLTVTREGENYVLNGKGCEDQ